MKIDLLLSGYSPAVSVHLDKVAPEDRAEVAGMLRGLMCAIDGWKNLSGLDNERFEDGGPVKLSFSSIENAHYFESRVNYYFSEEIMEKLRVTRRVYK